MAQFEIPDMRSAMPEDYVKKDRRGQMKRSWYIGVDDRKLERIAFDEGLTWGSIGQLLGYLFGEVDETFQDALYERLFKSYTRLERGKLLAETEETL